MGVSILNWSFILSDTGLVATFPDEQSLQDGLNEATLPSLITIKAKGGKYTVIGLDGSIRSPETQDVLDLMTGLVAAEENAIAIFVNNQAAIGNWGTKASSYTDSLIDYFPHFGLQVEANALISWRNVFTGTAVNAPTHTAGVGFAFDGVDQFIDSNYNPSTQGTAFIQDDAFVQAFVKTIADGEANAAVFGARDVEDVAIFRLNLTNRAAINNAQAGGSEFTDDWLLYTESLRGLSRQNSANFDLMKNGTVDKNVVIASSSIPNANIFIGELNGVASTNYSGTISSFVAGGGIGFNHLSFFNDLVTLNTALAAV